MLITINKRLGKNISIMEGNLLVVGNKNGVVSIKTLDPEKGSFAGIIHFTPAEINWLTGKLSIIKDQPASIGCFAFMDKSDTNKIPHSTIEKLLRGLC